MGENRQRIVVIGAGGHGHVVVDALLASAQAGSHYEVVALVDDASHLQGMAIAGVRVAGPIAALDRIPHDAVIVAIGDNGARRRIQEQLAARGVAVVAARHPSAVVSPEAVVDAGALVCAGAILGPLARIGAGAIVNTGARVDHHCAVGAFAHVAPGATLAGAASIGEEALVGVNAAVLPGVRVGARAVIGAGAVVVRDVSDGVTAVGVPARVVAAARS